MMAMLQLVWRLSDTDSSDVKPSVLVTRVAITQ